MVVGVVGMASVVGVVGVVWVTLKQCVKTATRVLNRIRKTRGWLGWSGGGWSGRGGWGGRLLLGGSHFLMSHFIELPNLLNQRINGLTVPRSTTTRHEFPVNRLYECKPVKMQ